MFSELFESPFGIEGDGTVIVLPNTQPYPIFSFFSCEVQRVLHKGLAYSFPDGRLLGINAYDLDGRPLPHPLWRLMRQQACIAHWLPVEMGQQENIIRHPYLSHEGFPGELGVHIPCNVLRSILSCKSIVKGP